jgi:hypothetical protein
MRHRILFSLSILLCLFVATSLSAQATRTWVSGVGDDVNPCSRTAPCKTFAGAISKTATCGEISVLDPGGFGVVTITKSITIDGTGTKASITNSLANGITINITVSDSCNTVILRNLDVNGGSNNVANLGLSGIRLLGSVATNLHIEHVAIAHQLRGIDIAPAVAQSRVFMKDVDIRHTTTHGIDVRPNAGLQVRLSFEDVTSRNSAGDGLRVGNDVRGTIANSAFQGNNNGVNVVNNSSIVMLADTVISQNITNGLINGGTATTLIDGCTITNNGTGLLNNTGGTVFGFANNAIAGNATDVTGAAVTTTAHP